MPGGGGHRDEMDGVIGRAAGRMQADDAVDDRALVDDVADRREFVAERGQLERPLDAEHRSARRAAACSGLTKDAPGRCSPMISISIWLVLAVP